MKIAIIGTGQVGGALATKWAQAGHHIYLGVQDLNNFKGRDLLNNPHTTAHVITDAVKQAEIILLAVPAKAAVDITKSLGDTTGKIIIDAMNIVMKQGPAGYTTTAQAILDHTHSQEVVKCFNTTGYNNMINPMYDHTAIDLFVAGNSVRAKNVAIQLAKDAGFAECYDVGGNDKFELLEQFAWFWINLAMFQGHGRNIGFKLLKR